MGVVRVPTLEDNRGSVGFRYVPKNKYVKFLYLTLRRGLVRYFLAHIRVHHTREASTKMLRTLSGGHLRPRQPPFSIFNASQFTPPSEKTNNSKGNLDSSTARDLHIELGSGGTMI